MNDGDLIPPADLPSVISSGGIVVNSIIESENVIATDASNPLTRVGVIRVTLLDHSMFSSGPKVSH